MSEAHTYACDNCPATVVAKALPTSWDWIHIESTKTGQRHHSMHLCSACVDAMKESKGRAVIQRVIYIVSRKRKDRKEA